MSEQIKQKLDLSQRSILDLFIDKGCCKIKSTTRKDAPPLRDINARGYYETHIVNYTRDVLYVKDRNGNVSEISPCGHYSVHGSGIEIGTRQVIGKRTISDYRSTDLSCGDVKISFIPESEIDNDAYYIEELNLIILKPHLVDAIAHPQNESLYKHLEYIEEMIVETSSSSVIRFYVNDSEKRFNSLFVNMFGGMCEVNATHLSSEPNMLLITVGNEIYKEIHVDKIIENDGKVEVNGETFYIGTKPENIVLSKERDSRTQKDIISKRYFDESVKKECDKKFAELKKQHAREVEELEYKNTSANNKIRELEQQVERLEAQTTRLERTNESLEQANNNMEQTNKRLMDEREQERKERISENNVKKSKYTADSSKATVTSNWVKAAPAIITAIVAIGTWMYKMLKKNDGFDVLAFGGI